MPHLTGWVKPRFPASWWNGTQCDGGEFVNSVEYEANESSHLPSTILAEMTIQIDSLKKADWSDERAGWSLEKTV